MALPQAVLTFLNEKARNAGAALPKDSDDLFKMGILDSFELVDFISVLEEHTEIKIPDSDVNQENFQTIDAVEKYIREHKG